MIPTDSHLTLRSASSPRRIRSGVAAMLLRQRLLLALGLMPLSVAGCATGNDDSPAGGGYGYGYGYDSGNSCSGWDGDRSSTDQVVDVLSDETSTCPSDPVGSALFVVPFPDCEYLTAIVASNAHDYGAYDATTSAILLSQVGAECTYEITCSWYEECPGGRPLEQDGAAVLAEAAARDDWRRGALRPDVAGLTDTQRQALAAYWSRAAREEHSSVAGFHKLALDLLAHGAPPELLRRVHDAASDEIRHATDAFSLASTYGGRPVGPGPLPMADVKLATSLVELAVATAREGAINETMAAWVAEARLQHTTDPAVRAALQDVVREETAHAELAFEILKWALDQGGEPVRQALVAVFTQLEVGADGPGREVSGLEAHGVLSTEAERSAMRHCVHAVLKPVAEALLAPVARAA